MYYYSTHFLISLDYLGTLWKSPECLAARSLKRRANHKTISLPNDKITRRNANWHDYKETFESAPPHRRRGGEGKQATCIPCGIAPLPSNISTGSNSVHFTEYVRLLWGANVVARTRTLVGSLSLGGRARSETWSDAKIQSFFVWPVGSALPWIVT